MDGKEDKEFWHLGFLCSENLLPAYRNGSRRICRGICQAISHNLHSCDCIVDGMAVVQAVQEIIFYYAYEYSAY